MKSKKRHEMETNELAASLFRMMEQAKQHQRSILYGAIAVVVVVAILVIWPTLKGRTESAAAASFASALYADGPDAMRDFCKDYPDAKQVPLAKLAAADRLVQEVVRGLRVAAGEDPKAKAARYLAEARNLYSEIAKDPTLEPLARTGLALADVQEGGLDKGKAGLQEVVNKWPESLAAAKAKQHLEALAGYKPMAFSNEPLKEEKEPGAKSGEPKEGESKSGAKAPEMTGPEPKAPAEKTPAPAETKPKEPKPVAAPDANPKG